MRTGKCFLCGEPSNPAGIGGRLERCLKCKTDAARARRERWSKKNALVEAEMKRAWRKAHPDKKKAASDAWRKANKERWNETGKAWKKRHPSAMRIYQLRKHSLTPETFAVLLESQGGKCAICGTSEWGGPGKRPHVDHDHKTGAVRGLLCVRCNSGIGQFKESTQRLLLAVDYLIEHGAPGILPETA